MAWAQPPTEKPRPSGQTKPPGEASKAAAGKKMGTAADEAAVRALAEQYQQAFNSGDPRQAAVLYADNGVFVDVDGTAFEGRAEIERNLAGDGTSKPPRLTLTVDAVRFVKPDVALMRGKSTVESPNVPPGGGGGHWAVVAMKVAGQWKVIAAQAAMNPPPKGRGM
jgi:uncharacterized protein (TIGR02246 family)